MTGLYLSAFVFILFVLTCARPIKRRSIEPGKYLQRINLITGEKFVKDLSFSNPDQIRRFRLLIALSQAASDSKFVDVFRLRMRWIDPEYWNDNFNETDRVYELKCEIEDEDSGMTFTFFEIHTDSLISGYDENFVVHESLPLLLRCRIRAKNSYGLEGRWKWSKTVKLYKLYSHPITSEPDSDLRRYKHFSER